MLKAQARDYKNRQRTSVRHIQLISFVFTFLVYAGLEYASLGDQEQNCLLGLTISCQDFNQKKSS
jgi:hypothetical protein